MHNHGWKIQMFDKAKKAPEAYLREKNKSTHYMHIYNVQWQYPSFLKNTVKNSFHISPSKTTELHFYKTLN